VNGSVKRTEKREQDVAACSLFSGALRRGNKPPVQPGEDKKAVQKKNLQV